MEIAKVHDRLVEESDGDFLETGGVFQQVQALSPMGSCLVVFRVNPGL